MLEESRRDFPEDYNPPARLAIAYLNLKQWDRAIAASDQAMARAYGPRKLRIYDTRSEIYAGSGDSTAAKHTLESALAYGDSLPDPRPKSLIASLRKKLDHYH